MDIRDVPIARLSADYLAYLEFMSQINIDTAGTFTLMAATLVDIKSRALLPTPGREEGEEEDPRLQIVRPLLDYMKVRDAADMLQRRELLERDVFLRARHEEAGEEEELFAELHSVSVFDLVDALRSLLEGRREEPLLIEVGAETVEERMERLARLLARSGGTAFVALFPGAAARREIIITFLALLEMVKAGLVRLIQDEAGNITVLPPLAGVA